MTRGVDPDSIPRYEMGNHEYHINGEGDWDVLS